MKKKIIYGCEASGNAYRPYLTRYYLITSRQFELYLHVIRVSDTPGLLHDHPWDFWTLVLWRGYTEVLPDRKRRVWPGQLLYRPSTWIHNVSLLDGKPAVTLTLVGKRKRNWYFYDPVRFGKMLWSIYIKKFCS